MEKLMLAIGGYFEFLFEKNVDKLLYKFKLNFPNHFLTLIVICIFFSNYRINDLTEGPQSP